MARLTDEQIDKWVEELRKPDAKQCREAWKDETGKCCLTVLYEDVLGLGDILEQGCPPSSNKSLVTAAVNQTFEGSATMVPSQYFMHMNDLLGFSFSQIADRITTMEKRTIPEGFNG